MYFHELPSEIMCDIMSRLPVKSLARFRCVSKQWCNIINDSHLERMHAKQATAVDGPMLIVFHQSPSSQYPNSPCILSFMEYNKEDTLLKKKAPVMEFMCMSSLYRYPDDIVLGSCNGLLYSLKANTFVVIHPLRKECYELPPLIIHSRRINIDCDYESSSGLGFDQSTNTFKMVFVTQRKHTDGLFTMVHVLGTESWRKIPQLPSYPISGEGVFANGCLHWLISDDDDNEYPTYLGRPVIRFDMAKEEFGLIHPPHQQRPASGLIRERLVELHGEVGYVYHIVNRRIEVWVLKERGWVMHCGFKQKPPLIRNGTFIKVLGIWNEDGDVLMTGEWKQMLVYNLNSDSLYKIRFVDWDKYKAETDIRMYQCTLFSTRYSIKY